MRLRNMLHPLIWGHHNLVTAKTTLRPYTPQVSKRVCLSTPFVKEATQKGSRKEHCMCIKENKTFHRKAFSATLQASTHLFDTCENVVLFCSSQQLFFLFLQPLKGSFSCRQSHSRTDLALCR